MSKVFILQLIVFATCFSRVRQPEVPEVGKPEFVYSYSIRSTLPSEGRTFSALRTDNDYVGKIYTSQRIDCRAVAARVGRNRLRRFEGRPLRHEEHDAKKKQSSSTSLFDTLCRVGTLFGLLPGWVLFVEFFFLWAMLGLILQIARDALFGPNKGMIKVGNSSLGWEQFPGSTPVRVSRSSLFGRSIFTIRLDQVRGGDWIVDGDGEPLKIRYGSSTGSILELKTNKHRAIRFLLGFAAGVLISDAMFKNERK